MLSSPRRVARKLSRSFSVPSPESAVTSAILHQVRFHGGRDSTSDAADDIVPVTESQRMFAAMKKVSSDAHYTEYPGVGHQSWVKAYDDPKLFPWLFSKSLATNPR